MSSSVFLTDISIICHLIPPPREWKNEDGQTLLESNSQNLDQKATQQNHPTPPAFGVIMLKNSRNSPFPHCAGTNHHFSTYGFFLETDRIWRFCRILRKFLVLLKKLGLDSCHSCRAAGTAFKGTMGHAGIVQFFVEVKMSSYFLTAISFF